MGFDQTQEFEIMYQNNFQLEHTIIDYVLYFDDEENKYVKASMELFGKSSLINTYTKKGELWKQTRSTTRADILEYKIIDINDNMIVMELGSTTIKVYYDSYLLIKQHYDKINAAEIENIKVIAKNIEQKVDICIKDEELVLMLSNFLDNIPEDYYVNPLLIIQTETYIVYRYKNCGELFLLLSDEIKRASHARIETNRVGNNSYEKLILENDDLISSYFENGLNLLFELVQEKYELEESVSVYVVYILINRLVESRFATEWVDKYGLYFVNILEIDLDKALETYFCIETINHDNLHTAGKFIYYLMDNGKFKNNNNYLTCYDEFIDSYNKAEKMYKMNNFKKRLQISNANLKQTITIDDIDLMNGAEFEQTIANLFNKMGYKVNVTKQSGDQGIDVIAERNGTKIGIQAKNYSSAVTNSAIQEVAAGIIHYKLDKGIVVTNNLFTKSAAELAESNNIVLWDRNILKEKIIILND